MKTRLKLASQSFFVTCASARKLQATAANFTGGYARVTGVVMNAQYFFFAARRSAVFMQPRHSHRLMVGVLCILLSACVSEDEVRALFPPSEPGTIRVDATPLPTSTYIDRISAHACAERFTSTYVEVGERRFLSPVMRDRLKAKALEELKIKASLLGATRIARVAYYPYVEIAPCRGEAGVRVSGTAYRD